MAFYNDFLVEKSGCFEDKTEVQINPEFRKIIEIIFGIQVSPLCHNYVGIFV